MNSSDAFELFSGYLEGELSAEEADALRRHFESSPEDQLAYDEFAATVELVRALPKAEAPSDFTDVVMRAVREARLTGSTSGEYDDSILPAPFASDVHVESDVESAAPAAVISGGGDRGWWLGAIGIAAMLTLGFFSGRVLLSPSGSDSEAFVPTTNEAPALAVSGAAETDGTAEALWNELQPLSDEPIRQVGSSDDRPSIVF